MYYVIIHLNSQLHFEVWQIIDNYVFPSDK
jgi:hypothetical protein